MLLPIAASAALLLAFLGDSSSTELSEDEIISRVERDFEVAFERARRDTAGQERMGGVDDALQESLALYFMFIDTGIPFEKKRPALDALLYFINPADDVPDVGAAGWLDDFAVIHKAYVDLSAVVTDAHRTRAKQVLASVTPAETSSNATPAR